MNYAIRIYDDLHERIPKVGEVAYSLKGGQRTNFFGKVPLLNGSKKVIGVAKVLTIISAKPDEFPKNLLLETGFSSIKKALSIVTSLHSKEFNIDGVITLFKYKVTEIFDEPKDSIY